MALSTAERKMANYIRFGTKQRFIPHHTNDPSGSQNAVHKTFTGRNTLMQDNIDKLLRLAEQRFERCDKKSGCSALEDAQKLIDSSEFPELLYEQRQNILVLKTRYGCEEV